VAKLKDGGVQFDVMSRAEVESIRARSKSADNGPWVTDFAAMAVKTVVRRLFKFLPVSIEIQRAVGLDEMAEAGMSQQNSAVIDGDFAFVDEPPALTDDPSPTVDVAGYEKRIAECKDLAMVQVLSDEIDPMPTEARERLMPLLIARDKELAGAR
jgi:recombination protein RecT